MVGIATHGCRWFNRNVLILHVNSDHVRGSMQQTNAKRVVSLQYLLAVVLKGLFVEHFLNVNAGIPIGGGHYVFQNSIAMLFMPTSTNESCQ